MKNCEGFWYLIEKFFSNIQNLYKKLTFFMTEQTPPCAFGTECNTWISIDYCKHWGLWEGIREILQNQMDGMTAITGSKKNFLTTKCDPDGLHYKFKQGDKVIGGIDFYQTKEDENQTPDDENQTPDDENDKKKYPYISIWNAGRLYTSNLLLGGNKAELNNPEIIGKFGEGMKLSALVISRLKNKEICIINGKEKWNFSLKRDTNFVDSNKQSQQCLFWVPTKYPKGRDGIIDVQVSGISVGEWTGVIDKILWLTDVDQIYPITAFEGDEIKGQILFGSKFRNKIFVKDIYVQDLVTSYGFNGSFDIDRDRNSLLNEANHIDLTSHIVAYVLNNYDKLFNNYHSSNYYDECLGPFPNKILECLTRGDLFVRALHSYINQSAANQLWDLWIEKHHSDKPYIQPASSAEGQHILNYMMENKLDESFYEYDSSSNVSYWSYLVFTKSSHYTRIDTKFEQARTHSTPVPITDQNDKNVIDEITQKVILACPSFKADMIQFREFPNKFSKDFIFTASGNIYFSSEYLKQPKDTNWKTFIFSKCLSLKGVSIEAFVRAYKIIQ